MEDSKSPKPRSVLIHVMVPEALLRGIDQLIAVGRFTSRSEAVREAINRLLREELASREPLVLVKGSILDFWKQVEPVVVSLKPGEIKRVGDLIIEKKQDGTIAIYSEVEAGSGSGHSQ